MSDLGVGLFSLPATMLFHVGLEEKLLCMMHPFLQFFIGFPFLFSLALTMIISIDRCLLITTPNFHLKFGKLYFTCFIPVILFASVATTAVSAFNAKMDSEYIYLALVLTLLVITIVIAASQIYLIWYVRERMAKMKSCRHSSINYQKRTIVTVAMLFFCAVLCNMPYFTWFCLLILGIGDDVYIGPGVRSPTTWLTFLLYSNSLLNSIIILKRSSNFRENGRK